ncbi:MAG TPA: AAA family ATPase, partial [Vicinamibacteria bacterium]|nr:AAA family ATPase [Vicinamibacteria bacterium]
MKALRIPDWLHGGLLDRYHAGASHLFLLHGNVRDLQPFGPGYLPLADGLRRLGARRAVLVSYDVSKGLTFPDAAREKEFRR